MALDPIGLALNGAEVVIRLIDAWKARTHAHKEIPVLLANRHEQVSRIRDRLVKFRSIPNSQSNVKDEFQKVADEVFNEADGAFKSIASELNALDYIRARGSLKNWFQSPKSHAKLSSIFSLLDALERKLDVCGLVAFSHASITHELRVQAQNLLLQRKELKEFTACVGEGTPASTTLALSTSSSNDQLDELEHKSLEAVTAITATERELLNMLASSGFSRDQKCALTEAIGAFWRGWKLNDDDVEYEYEGKLPARLGGGNFAEVYKGTLRERGSSEASNGVRTKVAVKVLNISPNDDLDHRRASFLRETFLQMDMDHPHILKSYGGFWPDTYTSGNRGRPFIATERMDYNLNTAVMKGYLEEDKIQVQVAQDIANGVAHLHARRVIHRDLKPENVLLRLSSDQKLDGPVKVGDFGVSRRIQKMQRTHYCATNKADGSMLFMPPEVLLDNENCVSRRSWDVWSFGVLLCYMSSEDRKDISNIPILKLGEMANNGELVSEMHRIASRISNDLLKEVAKICLHNDANSRPKMEDVRKLLHGEVALDVWNARIIEDPMKKEEISSEGEGCEPNAIAELSKEVAEQPDVPILQPSAVGTDTRGATVEFLEKITPEEIEALVHTAVRNVGEHPEIQAKVQAILDKVKGSREFQGLQKIANQIQALQQIKDAPEVEGSVHDLIKKFAAIAANF